MAKNNIKKGKKLLKEIKPLGKPLPNKFLVLMIKNQIVNGEEK